MADDKAPSLQEPTDPDKVVDELMREADKSSDIAQSALARANKRLADAAEAGRALRRRRAAVIDQLFVHEPRPMSKEQAFAEAQRRLGRDAFVWRVPTADKATRFVVGVREERLDKIVLAAAGAGASWELALANQLENAKRKDEEVLAHMKMVEQISEVCHEANRAWTKVADPSVPLQPHWDECPEEMRRSSRAGVAWRLANMDEPSSAGHDEWMRGKLADGWVLGPEKDAEKKTHPALVPYEQLPVESRKKDFLFAAIVMALGKWESFKAPTVGQ